MGQINARYEFRAFANNFGLVEEKIRQLSEIKQIRESKEWYILSRNTDSFNMKIRFQTLDVKELLQTKDGLEQWYPVFKEEFPLNNKDLKEKLSSFLHVDLNFSKHTEFELKYFLEQIVLPQKDLVLADVFKRRFGFETNECMAEIAEVFVNGAYIKTASVESEDVQAAIKLIKDTGLDAFNNTSYLAALKRITGLKPYISV